MAVIVTHRAVFLFLLVAHIHFKLCQRKFNYGSFWKSVWTLFFDSKYIMNCLCTPVRFGLKLMGTVGICIRSFVFLFSLANYVKAFLPLQSIFVVFGSIVLLSHGFRGPLCWQYWVIHGGSSSVSVLMNLLSTIFLDLHYFQPKLGMHERYRMLSTQNFL